MTCVYSFGHADFEATRDDEDTLDFFNLEFTSVEATCDGEKNFVVTVQGVCNADAEAGSGSWTVVEEATCSALL